jgi:hypothetical protein
VPVEALVVEAVVVADEAPLVPPVVAEPPSPQSKKKDKKDKKDKKAKKKKKNKEAVVLRFEGDQLAVIDRRAEALGLSRAALVRMIVAQALAG